jgi:hypothetical protein
MPFRSRIVCAKRGARVMRFAGAAAIALVIGACASPRETVEPIAATPAVPAPPAYPLEPARSIIIEPEAGLSPADRLEQMLAYAEKVRGMTPAPLEAEYARAREEHRRSPSAYSRLRLAVLLGCRRAPFYDEVQARDLLGQVARSREPDTAGMRSLAGLWLHEREERAAVERALEEERRQRAALQKKLEQLKTMEEEFDRRPPTPVIPSR